MRGRELRGVGAGRQPSANHPARTCQTVHLVSSAAGPTGCPSHPTASRSRVSGAARPGPSPAPRPCVLGAAPPRRAAPEPAGEPAREGELSAGAWAGCTGTEPGQRSQQGAETGGRGCENEAAVTPPPLPLEGSTPRLCARTPPSSQARLASRCLLSTLPPHRHRACPEPSHFLAFCTPPPIKRCLTATPPPSCCHTPVQDSGRGVFLVTGQPLQLLSALNLTSQVTWKKTLGNHQMKRKMMAPAILAD